ncbi:acetyltransferase [Methanocalculus chunghsingensis]|uniref:Acetyltransferase n=1 Tax=Methanocalculus chunghsingensis TaxID=156457 RepID=A0A8J8B5Y1_9EURY|nr:alpha/beta fold hydrolase [Methanocalculus chunghsingensis]MBR1369613.1 acetyltransferase [Methanocalculus chunghsingensis]
MKRQYLPVLLVHGWKSRPRIWRDLITRLTDHGIPAWAFAYTDDHPETVATDLRRFIAAKRKESGYSGDIDIITHSMGTHITRYLLEVIDGSTKEETVRNLIGIGPPNNGSSMAELFCDAVHGEEMINRLAGAFVPKGYIPDGDALVQEVRPRSPTMKRLRRTGLRDDITYRFILGENLTRSAAFFPVFGGRTPVYGEDGEWKTTWAGDGVIPHTDSIMAGGTYEVLPSDPLLLTERPWLYCHTTLPGNPEVISRILRHLTGPEGK